MSRKRIDTVLGELETIDTRLKNLNDYGRDMKNTLPNSANTIFGSILSNHKPTMSCFKFCTLLLTDVYSTSVVPNSAQ